MSHAEPDKSGLPRVVGRAEISTKTKFGFNNHISDLINLIFKVACEEQLPGNYLSRVANEHTFCM